MVPVLEMVALFGGAGHQRPPLLSARYATKKIMNVITHRSSVHENAVTLGLSLYFSVFKSGVSVPFCVFSGSRSGSGPSWSESMIVMNLL